jgi:hypothetical protein
MATPRPSTYALEIRRQVDFGQLSCGLEGALRLRCVGTNPTPTIRHMAGIGFIMPGPPITAGKASKVEEPDGEVDGLV